MKKNALAAVVFLILFVSAGTVFSKDVSRGSSNINVVGQAKVTLEEARKIALKKVEGKIEDEYTIEDENETVTTFVFVIKNKEGKTFEVAIDAGNGEILSAEEQTDDSEEDSVEPPRS